MRTLPSFSYQIFVNIVKFLKIESWGFDLLWGISFHPKPVTSLCINKQFQNTRLRSFEIGLDFSSESFEVS